MRQAKGPRGGESAKLALAVVGGLLVIVACGSTADGPNVTAGDAGGAAQAPSAGSEGVDPGSNTNTGDSGSIVDASTTNDVADGAPRGDAASCTGVRRTDLLGGCADDGFSSFSWTCDRLPYSITFSIIGGPNGNFSRSNVAFVPPGGGPSPFGRCQRDENDAIALAIAYSAFPPPQR